MGVVGKGSPTQPSSQSGTRLGGVELGTRLGGVGERFG